MVGYKLTDIQHLLNFNLISNSGKKLFQILRPLSIVGPRPQMKVDFERFPEHVQRVIYNVRPGITGLGSIVFRDEERLLSQPGIDPVVFYTEKIAPYKGELEIWYQQHASLWLDIKLIFLTAWVIVKPESELPFRWLKGLPEQPEYLK